MIEMYRMLRIYLYLCLLVCALPSNASPSDECVILIHGLGRTERSMNKIENRLLSAGYRAWNGGYSSTKYPIPELSETAIGEGLNFCELEKSQRIHFVTHSLGGILVRFYLQDREIDNLGRIVMLAPPNHGSEVADELIKFDWFEQLLGPAAIALGTGPQSVPNSMGPISGEIGIIAGNATSDPWFSPMIPGEDDGKVSVEATRLGEMVDFLIVPESHTFIMRDRAVIEQILIFLREGKFIPQPPSPDSSYLTDR